MTHTGFVRDAAFLVVAGVAPPLLGWSVVRHEGCVTLLTELVLAHNLVLPHRLRHLGHMSHYIVTRGKALNTIN